MKIEFWLDPHGTKPVKAHSTDAGFDFYATSTFDLLPQGQKTVLSGVHMNIPAGYAGLIKSRSGMAFQEGIICDTGVIDAGYTGEIGILIYNRSRHKVTIKRGQRIAQMVIVKIPEVELEETVSVAQTERGQNGFGSSGK